MGMTRVLFGIAAMLGFGLVTTPARAHHAFASEFDANRPVKVQGTIVKVDFVNPHSWFHVDVKNADGEVERWKFEAGNPGALARRGVTKDTIQIGTEVVIEGFLSRGAPRRANGRVMRYASGPNAGQELFVGSTGTGAPQDGKDSSEAIAVRGDDK